MKEPSTLVSLLPLVLFGIGLAAVNFTLAKKKGYSAVRFTLLSLIPILNWFFTLYMIGAPDLILRKKVDAALPANAMQR